MPGIEFNTNNPLGLTTAGPGYSTNVVYPGQSGTQTSGYGYTFAQFPNQQTGINAGINYITGKINSGAVTTVQGLVNLFSPNDMAAFTQTTGLSANSPLDPSQAGLYAAGIASGEGTLNQFGGTTAFTQANAGASAGNWQTDPLGTAWNFLQNMAVSSIGMAPSSATAPLNQSLQGSSPLSNASLSSWLDKAFNAGNVTTWLGRGAIVVLGVVFILIALFVLAKGPQIVAKAAVVAA